MHRVEVRLPVTVPDVVFRLAWAWRYGLPFRQPRNEAGVDLSGDRDVEWSWVAARIPSRPGSAIDFGPGGSSLGLIAAMSGFDVTSVDLNVTVPLVKHDRLRIIEGDLLDLDLPEKAFDLVINCSTVEHVGLAGRYGVTQAEESGDLRAMDRLRQLMKPGALMLLTVPAGRDAIFSPLCRVYGPDRLPRLSQGFEIVEETYWAKIGENRWSMVQREDALAFDAYAGSWDPGENRYALACMQLRSPLDS